jgi:hypothetical protein
VLLIFIKDKRRGSLRLGEIVRLKIAIAIAIGVKVRASFANYISCI